MIRNTLYSLLSLSFILVSNCIKADKIREPNIIGVNNILMYENAAKQVIEQAKKENAKVIEDGASIIIIKNSELLKKIMELFDQAIQNSSTHNIINARSKDEEIIIFINREKRLIVDICINMD
jgi:hypothetical protein